MAHQQYPQRIDRRRSLNKKILGFGCLPIGALLVLVIILAAVGSSSDDSETSGHTMAKTPVPEYTVANKREKTKIGSVDLIASGVTVVQAKAAIHDYADKNIGDQFQDYGITVVRSDADKTYVCRAEWVASAQAAQLYTGGRIKSDSWPAIDINCPDF